MRKFLSRLLIIPGTLSGAATCAVTDRGAVVVRPGKLARVAAAYILWFGALTVFFFLLMSRSPSTPYLLVSLLAVSVPAYVGTSFLFGMPLRPRCPHCGAPAFLARPADGPEAVFLAMTACKSCGGILDVFRRAGRKPAPLGAGDYVRVTAVCGAAVAVLALAGASVVARAWDVAGTVAVERARREVVAAGFSFAVPPTLPKIADAENAVPELLLAGRATAPLSPDDAADLTKFVEAAPFGVSSKNFPKARGIVAAGKSALALVERAAAKKSIDWHVDWNRWPANTQTDDESRWPGRSVTLSNLAAGRALVEAEDGRGGAAVADIRLALWLAGAARARGNLVGQLTALSEYRRVLGAARAVLPRVAAEDAAESWSPFLAPDELTADFRRVLALYRFALWERLIAMNAAGPGDAFWIFRWLSAAEIKLDTASSHRFNAALLATLKLPYPEFNARAGELEASMWDRVLPFSALENSRLPLRRYYTRELGVVADMRLARAALNVRRALARGAAPQEISEIDPFNGLPLTIARVKNAWVLSSVGPGEGKAPDWRVPL